jgi:hypothetical protein
MGLMDSINVQYIWKVIQESERSDENLYPIATLSDWLSQASHSAPPQGGVRREPERGDGEKHTPAAGTVPPGGRALLPSRSKPDASAPSRRQARDG